MGRAYAFDHPHELEETALVDLLGGKGANLATMTRDLGLPVPPGFTITTRTCGEYLRSGWPVDLDAELDLQMARLEQQVGRRFGDPADPLLVSVRSGAPASMPGMMDTVLNLGLNDETVAGLAQVSGDDEFARRCHERFVEMFRSVVGAGDVPESPRDQLVGAIKAVFDSWNSDRARAYREVEGIDHRLGTAVTVQAMVFGNRSKDSATGVLFTRDPSNGAPEVFGDVLFDAQGEDVVDGSHAPQTIDALAERLPEVAEKLWEAGRTLERHHRDLCDIEFTVEDGELWLLQVRVGKRSPRAALRIAIDMAEDQSFPLTRVEALERVAAHLLHPPHIAATRDRSVEVLTSGLGASPGLVSGKIATSADEAVRMAAAGDDVILVRPETSPADVHGMADAVGVLTSTGGLASHAAVVARGWGVAAVVGAREVLVADVEVVVAGQSFSSGDVISIDGESGAVFAGAVDAEADVVPEVPMMMAWVEELELDLDALIAPAVGEPSQVDVVWEAAAVDPSREDDVVRVASIKNFLMPEPAAAALGVSVEALGAVVDRLIEGELLEEVGAMHRLSPRGQEQAAVLLAADQEALGLDAAVVALDDLHSLDQRMKQIVTNWQVRSVDGEDEMNDHTDEDYDRGVMAELESLHVEVEPWLGGLAEKLPRLDRYRSRLSAALARIVAGDGRYMAAPMLDSYHTVWFEMHEDLIRLAGRTREQEAAAGRA